MGEKMAVNYYHISESNLDGVVLNPRVPESRMEQEDGRKRRVCFSTNIRGCLKAIYVEYFLRLGDDEYYVHVPYSYKGKVYKPSEKEVPDSKETHEKWFLNKVKLRCVGKIKVRKDEKKRFTWKWMKTKSD